MSTMNHLVVGMIDAQRYGLQLSVVERILQAVEVTPLPLAPDIVMGVVDVRGQVLPVVNMRRRFGLAEGPVEPSDQFIIANTGKRLVLVVMDRSRGFKPIHLGHLHIHEHDVKRSLPFQPVKGLRAVPSRDNVMTRLL